MSEEHKVASYSTEGTKDHPFEKSVRYLDSLLAERSPPDTLYHYTSPEGFLGIVASRSLFATDVLYLNDALESHLADSLLSYELAEAEGSTKDANQLSCLQTLSAIVTRSMLRSDLFVASMSEQPDALSQWRSYCPASGGYTLGFSAKGLRAVPNAALLPCVYDPRDQATVCRNVISFILNQHWPNNVVLSLESSHVSHLLRAIIKHESFSGEEEWRLVVIAPSRLTGPILFRTGRIGLIPYVQLSLAAENERMPLDVVRVGPNPEPQLAIEAAERFLATQSMRWVSVLGANTSFRSIA